MHYHFLSVCFVCLFIRFDFDFDSNSSFLDRTYLPTYVCIDNRYTYRYEMYVCTYVCAYVCAWIIVIIGLEFRLSRLCRAEQSRGSLSLSRSLSLFPLKKRFRVIRFFFDVIEDVLCIFQLNIDF